MASIFQNDPVNAKFISPTPGNITLLAGYPNSGSSLVDASLCSTLKNNGFNAKTATYYYAKKVNEEIKKYSDLFLNMSVTKITDISQSDNYTQVYPGIRVKFLNGDGVIASAFGSSGGMYIMIVSKDVVNYQTIEIEINVPPLTEITPIKSDGVTDYSSYINTTLTRILIPGGYRIFQLQPLS